MPRQSLSDADLKKQLAERCKPKEEHNRQRKEAADPKRKSETPERELITKTWQTRLATVKSTKGTCGLMRVFISPKEQRAGFVYRFKEVTR